MQLRNIKGAMRNDREKNVIYTTNSFSTLNVSFLRCITGKSISYKEVNAVVSANRI
jgi:hypothetical protein